MTLILSSVVGDQFMAISDILLSVPGARLDAAADLPLHYQPLAIATKNHTVVGTAQKAILIGRRILLQWAGSQVFAGAVARAIQDAIDAGQTPDIPAIILDPEMGADAQMDSALIVNVLAPDNLIARYELRACKADGNRTLYAGTGAFNFLDDVETELTAQGGIDEKATDRWYSRLALVVAEEFYFHEPLQFAYGGWHEVVRNAPWGFVKAPYLVKFWTLAGEALTSGPVFSSWYADQHLCVLSATGGNGPDTVSKLEVVAAWNRPAIDEAAALAGFEQAYFQIHVVHQDGGMKFFFESNPWPDGFNVTLVDGKPLIHCGPALVPKLMSAEGRAGTLSRRSDPDL